MASIGTAALLGAHDDSCATFMGDIVKTMAKCDMDNSIDVNENKNNKPTKHEECCIIAECKVDIVSAVTADDKEDKDDDKEEDDTLLMCI